MRHALDTNIWRYLLTDKDFAARVAHLALAPLGLPAVVMFELRKMPRNERARKRIEDICQGLAHTTIAPTASDWAASATTLKKMREYFRFEKVGMYRLQNDALIAHLCARLGWTLVTADRVDFERLALVMGTRAAKTVYLSPP